MNIREQGQLRFFKTTLLFGKKLVKEVAVFWELEKGKLERNNSWVISVSFSPTFEISDEARGLVFAALLVPSIKMRFKTKNFESDCVICDISDFADTNVIEVGSPDHPPVNLKLVRRNRGPQPEKVEKWVLECFHFLVGHYGLSYRRESRWIFSFQSSNICIHIHPTARDNMIYISRPGERIYCPGGFDFSELTLETVVRYFEGRSDVGDILFNRHDYSNSPLKDNLRFVAGIFQRYADRIINQIDEWWLPVHVYQYKLAEQRYKDAGKLDIFVRSYGVYYEYLKSKGALE